MSDKWFPDWIRAHWPTCGWLDEVTATFDPDDPGCALTGWCDKPADYVAAHEQDDDEPSTEGWCAEHVALVRADPAQGVVVVETLVIEDASCRRCSHPEPRHTWPLGCDLCPCPCPVTVGEAP